MARKLVAVAFSLGCLHAGSLMALGLGEIKLDSFLNQPLKASVDLLNMGGLNADDIKVRLGTSDDFDKLGIDRAYFLTSIKFEVSDNGNGSVQIIISSEEPVLEPYLDFVVEARWPSGRLLREYTVLVDPPVFSQGTQVVSASDRVEAEEGIAAPAKKNKIATSETTESQDDDTIGSWGSEQGANSGTRVDMRDSNLAPGAMPQRRYNAATSGSPTPGSRYMISRDQTLWDIANRAKPAGASVHQTMLEIQRLNPDAFINGNINRIKAGYIIYLPNAGDITSTDVSATLAEVREQNAAWREGRDAQLNAAKRPSLRISAEPEETTATASPQVTTPAFGKPQASNTESTLASTAAAEPVKTSPLDTNDAQQRLAAIEEQLATLQRIVSLKDDQIAALQGALAEAGVASPDKSTTTVAQNVGASPDTPTAAVVPAENVPGSANTEATVPAAVPEIAPKEEAAAASSEPPRTASPQTPEKAAESGWMNYLLYLLGALALGLAGFVFSKRRSNVEPEAAPVRRAAPQEDVFRDVQLRDQRIKQDAPEKDPDKYERPSSARDNRGYGERKHDEYASDIDETDALAEADIYIAYGRHQQAIDLLNNAITVEPSNPAYRLKLLEIYTELNDRAASTSQLAKIKAIGDRDSIERAESLMDALHTANQPEPPKETIRKPVRNGPGLAPNPLAMMPDSNESLEDNFNGLEIEGAGTSGDDDDLDLSSDFDVARNDRFEDEELVIAADSNGLSTKLDLARAYLDMGDDDGARQILDEVVIEGSEELKAEARALLDRIGG